MKSLVFKAMMPVAAFVLASAGAIGTNNASAEAKGGAIQGWKRIAPFSCEQKRTCNNLGTIVCVDGVDQMYAKPSPSSDCDQLLTHRP